MKILFNWKYTDITIPMSEFDSQSACVFSNGDALLGGEQLFDQEARGQSYSKIYRYVKAEIKMSHTYKANGYIKYIVCMNSNARAIRGEIKPEGIDSNYFYLQSLDSGKTWNEKGRIPGNTCSQILSIDDDNIWAIGSHDLLKSSNNGKTWSKVPFQMENNSSLDRLTHTGNRVYLINTVDYYFNHLWYTDDDGTSWNQLTSEANRYYIVEQNLVIGKVDDTIKIGRINDDRIVWFHDFEGDFDPFKMVIVNNTIRFLATLNMDLTDRWKKTLDTGDGILLFESHDGGNSWSSKKIPGQPSGDSTDIAGEKAGISVAPYNLIFVP